MPANSMQGKAYWFGSFRSKSRMTDLAEDPGCSGPEPAPSVTSLFHRLQESKDAREKRLEGGRGQPVGSGGRVRRGLQLLRIHLGFLIHLELIAGHRGLLVGGRCERGGRPGGTRAVRRQIKCLSGDRLAGIEASGGQEVRLPAVLDADLCRGWR